jgi:Rrf2 family protein
LIKIVMKLSTRGDYAARLFSSCAHSKARDPSRWAQLAAPTGISLKYLEQIMMRLRVAGVVRAERGVHGGYTLAGRPDHVTVGEVVRLMDGPLAPSPCARQSARVPCPAYRCPTEERCVLRSLWMEVRDAIAAVLDSTTFADLAQRQRQAQAVLADRYYI